MACRRQAHATRIALEQGDAEVFLKLANGDRQRWLRDVQALCRAMEVQRFGKGVEIAQLAQVHDTYSLSNVENSILARKDGVA